MTARAATFCYQDVVARRSGDREGAGGGGKLFGDGDGDGDGGRQTLSGWARVWFLSVAVTVAVDTGLGGRSKKA